jgi:hypothetical protein
LQGTGEIQSTSGNVFWVYNRQFRQATWKPKVIAVQ